MNTELANRIIADLEKTGFSTELAARKILIDSGWSVDAGYGYLDKDEGKSREIDFVATSVEGLEYQGNSYGCSEFHICGEVKKSKTPWVVFDQDTHPSSRYCAWNNLISVINLPTKSTLLAKTLAKHSLIKINGWLGSGVHESFKDPSRPSRWYSSFVSALKASEYYLERISPEGEKETDDILENPCEAHFVQPLVILDAPLYRAVLTSSGKIEVSEIDSAAFRFGYRSRNYSKSSYRVDLVTMDGLPAYQALVKKRQLAFCAAIKKAANVG